MTGSTFLQSQSNFVYHLDRESAFNVINIEIIIQTMNVNDCNGKNIFIRNGTFHLSPNENTGCPKKKWSPSLKFDYSKMT